MPCMAPVDQAAASVAIITLIATSVLAILGGQGMITLPMSEWLTGAPGVAGISSKSVGGRTSLLG